MPAANRPPETALAFWRCALCGTPNPDASYVSTCLGCGKPKVIAAPLPSPPRPRPRLPRGRAWVAALCWAYLASMVVVLVGVKAIGERWWATTLLVFAPRYIFLYPVVPLAVLAAWSRRWRLVPVLALTLLIVAGPLMNASLPIGRLLAPDPAGPRLRVLTLNRATGQLDFAALNRLIERERIDVVCFQEATRYRDYPEKLAPGFHWTRNLRIASRHPILGELEAEFPAVPEEGLDPAYLPVATIRLPEGHEVQVASLDLPSMTIPLAAFRQGEFRPDLLRRYVEWRRLNVIAAADNLVRPRSAVVVAGDSNTPADSDVLDPFHRFFRNGFDSAGWGYGYTWSNVRRFLRIDHVLASRHWVFTRCEVGPAVGSDHLPVWAELVLIEPPG